MRVRHFGDSGDIENVSRQIGRVRTDGGLCILPEQRLKILVPDVAQTVCRNEVSKNAACLQILERPEDEVVLQVGGNDVVSRRKKAVARDIEHLGRVHRKNDVIFARAGKKAALIFAAFQTPCAKRKVRRHVRRRLRFRQLESPL